MSEVTERPAVLVACADSLEYLRAIPDGTYHACVTDPPYGLGDPPDPADVLQQWATAGDWHPRSGKAKGFMGAAWDKFVPGPAIWREVYRVLKPGAYCAVFAGTRTWDWMSLALRFAGFEVTDTLMWLHGQGFPKGGDVGKRIDEMLGAEREVVGEHPNPAGNRPGGSAYMMGVTGMPETAQITAPATPEAARWHDCSTTLKPAWEPIILAQKPHQGSAARNCVDYGAGALRVGACRIGLMTQAEVARSGRSTSGMFAPGGVDWLRDGREPQGRWPANLALDEEAAAALDEQVGYLHGAGNKSPHAFSRVGYEGGWKPKPVTQHDRGGMPSRFFYCAKANKGDRDEGLDHLLPPAEGPERDQGERSGLGRVDETHDLGAKLERWPDGSLRPRVTPPAKRRNTHPTVKPEALMRWLTRLVCPPWGELLDPFAGSGSTGKAAALEGLRATCVEREPDFAEVARARVAAALCRAAESAPAEVAPTAAAA